METPVRCPWGGADPLSMAYHDTEWGKPVHGDAELFERLSLEAFQSGLSWITILRKRQDFRTAFAAFDPAAVAQFDDADVARLMSDAGIVRNRRKINAVISNARVLHDWQQRSGAGVLDALIWSHQPEPRPRPADAGSVPAQTPESVALAKALKSRGLVFIGPTTTYAMMQACGLVDDHIAACEL